MQPNLLSGLLNNASTSMKVVQTNAKKKEELAKKELGTLSNVVKTTTAVAKANTPQVALGFGDKSNPQSLLELHKTTTGFQPLEFDNLMGTKQSGIPNLGFTDLGTKVVAPEKFSTPMDSITRDAQMVREDAVLRQNTTDDKVLKLMNQYTLSRDELFDLGAFKRKELEQQGEDTTGVDDVDLAEFALSETPEEEKAGFTRTGIIGSLQGAGIEGAEKQSQALAREQSGQQGVLSTKLQDVGSVAGYGADLIGDAFMGGLKKGGQLIDYITQGGASEVATAVGEKIKGTQFYNDVVAEGLNQLGQGIEQYNQRKQANPVEGANVDALLNIVDVGSQFIGGGVAKKAGQEALESGVARTIKEGVETGLQKGVKGLGNIGKTAGGIVEGFGNKVSGATDYAAKKLIDSKFKLTKTNKDAIRKSAGVEPSEFILENNIGGNNIDEMVENTKNMVDDAMQTKFQALSEVKELQPITQREKLIGQSIVKQAKGDIEEIYGKKFDEIGEDEIVPELKEQFTIVNNIEKVINEKEISPLKLEALKSLYDIYNSHLKYDLTKKRVLGAAEQIRLGLQSSIEGLGKTVGVDIKGLNKKIAGGKALEKGLIQAGDRLDNNNLFGLSDSQTAILSSALGGGGLEVAGVLGAKSLFENIGLRNKLARSLYTKKTPNVGSKITNNPSSVGTTAGSNITKQFGNTDTTMNGSKPIIQIKQKTPIDLGSNIDKFGNKITPKQGLSNLSNKSEQPLQLNNLKDGNQQGIRTVDTKNSGNNIESTPLTREGQTKSIGDYKKEFDEPELKKIYSEVERLNDQSEMYADVEKYFDDPNFEDYISTVTDPIYIKTPMSYDGYIKSVKNIQNDIMKEIRQSDPSLKIIDEGEKRFHQLEAMEQRIGKIGNNKVSKAESYKQSIELDAKRNQLREQLLDEGLNPEDLFASRSKNKSTYEPKKSVYVSKKQRFENMKNRVNKHKYNGLSNLKDQGDMPKLPPKTPKELPAKQKIADTPLSNLKNPKKPVQSDTLVSKSDEMEADRLANMQYAKEDIISNIQSIAKKNPEVIRKVLQKEGNIPDNKIESFIDDASNGKISERQAMNVRDAIGKSDEMSKVNGKNSEFFGEIQSREEIANKLSNRKPDEYYNNLKKMSNEEILNEKNKLINMQKENNIKIKEYNKKGGGLLYDEMSIENKKLFDDDIYIQDKLNKIDELPSKPKNPLSNLGKTVSKSDSMSKDLQPLYDEAKRYKSAEEFAKGLKNKDDVKAKILMDGFNERYKNRSFEDMLPKGIEYTPDQLSFFRSKVEPNMQLSLQDAKSLMNNDKSILDKINKKMGIDMTRSKEKGEIFDSQLRKIREEANKKSPGLSNLKNK